ncbi:MAG: glycosyltransferase involved in cell wall biosynthesis [Candidatus Azotimanducaceae bacterium]|jgi:glycosyltransferase involved in cell wall biosynthesis
MKVVVANQLVPGSLWAHDINVIRMAYGFAQTGNETTLICLSVSGKTIAQSKKLAESLYGHHPNLTWHFVGSWWNSRLFHRSARAFSNAALRLIQKQQPEFIYARDYLLPGMTTRSGFSTVVESHAHPTTDSPEFRQLIKDSAHENLKSWVTISESLGEPYVQMGVPQNKIMILPDAVDLDLFTRPKILPKKPFPKSSKINVVYTGHLYDYKGIPTILGAAKLLNEVHFHLVGGWPEDIQRHCEVVESSGLKNVTLHGRKQHNQIPTWLWHADLLLLPPSENHPSAAWTSPMKLAEYLASATPVISSDIPALRRWLTDEETLFVTPDDAQALADGVLKLLADPLRRSSMIELGLTKAVEMSFKNRAYRILKGPDTQ